MKKSSDNILLCIAVREEEGRHSGSGGGGWTFNAKLKQSVISRRKDARRGALAEKMGLMLDKSSCLMFEAFEDCKKKRR